MPHRTRYVRETIKKNYPDSMNNDFFTKLLLAVVLLLIQILMFNHIHLFDYATPLLFVYLVLTFRRGYPKWGILLWAFFLGLALDIFTNTPGLTSASFVVAALIQPYVLELFMQRESADDLTPSVVTLGLGKYILYALIIVLTFCLCFFSLETFNFFNPVQWLACIGGSAVITLIFVLVVENIRRL